MSKLTGVALARYHRAGNLRRKYGITPRQYNVMLKRQGGMCAICGRKPTGARRLDVDHDHETKRVRGLLCFLCNKWRVAKNTLETARRVVVYLESTFDGRAV